MRPILTLFVAAATLAAAPAALAQTIYTSVGEFSVGYGRTPGQENRAVENFGMRDGNGNLVIIDGVVQGNVSSYSASSASASASASASGGFSGGVGSNQSSASAIGNNLTVITQGDFNTVIVNSNQVNNGAVTAGSSAVTGGTNAQ